MLATVPDQRAHQLTQPNQSQVSQSSNKGKKKVSQARKGRLSFTSVVDIPKGALVMMGTFFIRGKPICVLFDSGATHSFVNGKTLSKVGLNSCNTNDAFTIKTAGGNISSELVTRGVPLELGSRTVDVDLIILGLEGIDVILGMDWMNGHKVVLDISERMVEINSPIVGATTLYLPFKDGVNPRSYVAITSQLEEIPVAREFADVFPDELPRMPPDRDVEFVIELQPGTAPISKRPYRMPWNWQN
jgi:predicted aspartyl protease